LKPIDNENLEIAVNKYKERVSEKQPISIDFNDIKKLLNNEQEHVYKKRFTVKVGQHLKMIAINDIECFYSENKGTYIHTSEGRDYLIDLTLEQLENELESQTFFRVNRKFYININAIKDMISYTNSRLQIKLKSYTAQEVIVSRERVRDFKDWLS
jgi:DNA-binding LytR/AlgR family response regulator